jgi:hypothetical protein
MLWWLTYQHGGDIIVTIQPAYSLIAARLRAALADIKGEFREGHQLDEKMAKKVPKGVVGKILTRKEAQSLLILLLWIEAHLVFSLSVHDPQTEGGPQTFRASGIQS